MNELATATVTTIHQQHFDQINVTPIQIQMHLSRLLSIVQIKKLTLQVTTLQKKNIFHRKDQQNSIFQPIQKYQTAHYSIAKCVQSNQLKRTDLADARIKDSLATIVKN